MKNLFTVLLLLCLAGHSYAQKYTVTGIVKDTLNQAFLPMSSVVLISKKDSIITSFTRTDSSGHFSITADKPGKYFLRITFPSFADYMDVITLDKPGTDMGIIPLETKAHLLKEFVLTKQISAIKIKGDTTEYVADSFKVKDDASVEALLKKLPGIQVDKNGQITAQGETVQKILVDGEEFFSDDPKVVTQGLQANVVDKVQVYDKKSEQAEFTGVDDGQKTKTINLQLKEDKKKGYFGKIDAGGGTDGYYQNQDMINAFKGKRQFSAFGILSNTDKVGLGWQDNNKFGSSSEMITDDDGNSYSIRGNDDGFTNWDGTYNGQGFPKVWTGGAHFANKWDEDKDHVTANYRYGKQQVDIGGNTITQYALAGDTSNASYMQKTQFSNTERHSIDAMYEVKVDTNTSIKISASGGHRSSQVLSNYTTVTSLLTADADDTLYTNKRNISANTNADFINSELVLKRKFAKKGRTISVDLKENYNDSRETGHLYSNIIPDSANARDSIIDQGKTNNVTTLAFSAKATYTEPITKVLNLELDYKTTVNNTTSKNYSDNYNTLTNKYDLLDTAYSSNYQYNILSNNAGLNFRWVFKKLNFSVGSNVSKTDYQQNDLLSSADSRRYSYNNIAPKASFKFKVKNQETIGFNYYGNTQQPTITEIQPLKQNADPTNITIGNPNLKQAFNNNFSLYFNNYKVLTHQWLYGNLDVHFAENAISTAITNSEGINTTQFVNVNGNYGASLWGGGGFKINKPDINVGVHLNPSLNHSVSFINGQRNTNDNNTYEAGLDFSKDKEDKYDISLSPSISYYDNKATISAYSTNYWMSNTELSGSVQLPKKFEIGSSVNFMFRERTAVFTTNNNVIKWNAYVAKKFLKKKQLQVRLSVFDILNQNIGYTRNAQGNVITQDSFNTIRRYGMLSIIWNFNHQPGATASSDEDDN